MSCAILFFTKTNSGGTDHVWFYDMQADGYSLDDKHQPLLSNDKFGLHRLSGRSQKLSEQDHTKNNLPDVLTRWAKRDDTTHGGERQRPRTAQSFCVPKADIAAQGHDLSINRYRQVVHAVVAHESPQAILARLAVLEDDIQVGMKALGEMLN